MSESDAPRPRFAAQPLVTFEESPVPLASREPPDLPGGCAALPHQCYGAELSYMVAGIRYQRCGGWRRVIRRSCGNN